VARAGLSHAGLAHHERGLGERLGARKRNVLSKELVRGRAEARAGLEHPGNHEDRGRRKAAASALKQQHTPFVVVAARLTDRERVAAQGHRVAELRRVRSDSR
jgi:hypothetical protein